MSRVLSNGAITKGTAVKLQGFIQVLYMWLRRPIARLVQTLGVIALIMIILAFTRLPYGAHRALALAGEQCVDQVDVIVVLGGSGMPSGPELLRLHHGALEAMASPYARVFVVHPKDTVVMDAMFAELVMKGVSSRRIHRLMEGTNTREQALFTMKMVDDPSQRIAVVTAPENIFRTIKAFKKAGALHICGVPAFDHAMFVDLSYDHRKAGGRAAVPDVSGNLDLRYNFWNYLKLEITCLREYAAIAYYKLNDWI